MNKYKLSQFDQEHFINKIEFDLFSQSFPTSALRSNMGCTLKSPGEPKNAEAHISLLEVSFHCYSKKLRLELLRFPAVFLILRTTTLKANIPIFSTKRARMQIWIGVVGMEWKLRIGQSQLTKYSAL